MRSRPRYNRIHQIPQGFTRSIALRDVKPGDELLWSDDSPIATVTQIELSGKAGKRYRVTTVSEQELEPHTEELGNSTKLFIRQNSAAAN